MSGNERKRSKRGNQLQNARPSDGAEARKRINRTIGALWIVLGCLVVAVASLLFLRDRAGKQAGWAADTLLNALSNKPAATAPPAEEAPIPTLAPVDAAAEVNATHLHDGDDGSLMTDAAYEQPDAPEMDQQELQTLINSIATSVGADGVVGVLNIPEIEVQLPIIGKWSSKLLKVSICRYSGGEPNAPGNLVVIGHNYKNGSHFGRLKKLEVGDEMFLAGLDGAQKRYVVYEIDTIKPDDFAALEPYRGECGLTLMTCYKDGTDRLLIRCEQVAEA